MGDLLIVLIFVFLSSFVFICVGVFCNLFLCLRCVSCVVDLVVVCGWLLCAVLLWVVVVGCCLVWVCGFVVCLGFR